MRYSEQMNLSVYVVGGKITVVVKRSDYYQLNLLWCEIYRGMQGEYRQLSITIGYTVYGIDA